MNIIKNAVCPACTLLCDDVTFQIHGQRIQSNIECLLAQRWIDWANANTSGPSLSSDELQSSMGQAAEYLKQSKFPLIAGLASLPLQSQQMAWKIADAVGAVTCATIGPKSQSGLYALQRHGEVTASLGEIANRGDLLIFWFCDPVRTHPRLMEKLNASGKTLLVVDSAPTQTSALSDQFISVDRGDAIDFLRQARGQLAGSGSGRLAELPESAQSKPNALVDWVTKSQFGCFFYGSADASAADAPAASMLHSLIRQFNDNTHTVSVALRSDGNGRSAENVMAAFSGYPDAVSHANGIPEHFGEQWSASRLLEQRRCDFVLLFAGWEGEAELESLGPTALANLEALPKVVISSVSPTNKVLRNNGVFLQVVTAGAAGGGDFCRMDDVLLPLTPLRESKLPTALAILKGLFESI